jgi:hypothetical protein
MFEGKICSYSRAFTNFRSHLAIAQDAMRQHGEHRFACRALDAPESDPAQTDASIRGVARQGPTSATGRLV